jgi:cardiolipin synthase
MNDAGPPPASARVAPPSTPDECPWFEVGADFVRLLRDGAAAFPAMLDAIARAEREILLEMYWIGTDKVGERFRDALAARAKEGVVVRVVYDSLGSFGMTSGFWDPLLDAGADVREYHSVLPFDPSFRWDRIEQRDHRKLLVVDAREGFTGGINLGQQWLSIEDGGEGWRDDMVHVRGEVAEEMRTLFYRTWRRVSRIAAPDDLRPLSRRRARPVFVLASQRRHRRSIHREYLVRITSAKRSVDIANSYFVPDRSVRSALFRAVARGVRVRVVLPERSDVPVVQFAAEALFDTLLRHGVEIYGMPRPMMHSKTAIIDRSFVTIGSYNLDERSWRKNLEINLAVEHTAFAEHVATWFDRDVARSLRVDVRRWRDRSIARRGVEWVAWALRELW